MSSLFQGLTNQFGLVQMLETAPGGTAVGFRGFLVEGTTNAVYVSTTLPIAHFVAGVPITSDGRICVSPGSTPGPNFIPGGLREADDKRLLRAAQDQAADVIHQGVGLLNNGALCHGQGGAPASGFEPVTSDGPYQDTGKNYEPVTYFGIYGESS